jgi:hypothetical protein
MKKVLLTIIAALTFLAAKSQTLYELRYYDIIDDATYNGLFFFTDEENCFLRCVTDADQRGKVSWWEYNYQCQFDKQNGVNYLYFIPEEKKKKDDPLIPAFCMGYSPKGDFESVTWAIFQDLYEEDDIDDDNMKEVEYFREVDLREKDEDYFLQFYDADEEMFQKIMKARKQLIGQNDNGKPNKPGKPSNNNSVAEGPVTMHLILVAATQDESIGESVMTDANLVKKNFSEIAKKLNIEYKETTIMGSSFKKANIENAVDRLNPGSNDIVVFVYSGHGFRYDDDTDAYPRMYLTYGSDLSEKTELSTTELYNEIVAKKARLTIFLTDCCNSKAGVTRAEVESVAFGTRGTNNNVDIDKLYDLFIDESGTIRATAAKAGQYALCDASGGFMLTSILNNIKSQTSALANGNPSWQTIIENASKVVAKKTSNQIDEAGNETAPQVVVRAVKVRDLGGNNASSFVSSDNESESLIEVNTRNNSDDGGDDGDDTVVDFLCVAIPIIGLLGLILIIVMLIKRKKN